MLRFMYFHELFTNGDGLIGIERQNKKTERMGEEKYEEMKKKR